MRWILTSSSFAGSLHFPTWPYTGDSHLNPRGYPKINFKSKLFISVARQFCCYGTVLNSNPEARQRFQNPSPKSPNVVQLRVDRTRSRTASSRRTRLRKRRLRPTVKFRGDRIRSWTASSTGIHALDHAVSYPRTFQRFMIEPSQCSYVLTDARILVTSTTECAISSSLCK